MLIYLIYSSPSDIVINHDIIRVFNEEFLLPRDILINHDIIRIFNEVRISSSPCDIVLNLILSEYLMKNFFPL